MVGDKYRVRELTERMVCLGSECWERWKRCEVSGCSCVMREGEGEERACEKVNEGERGREERTACASVGWWLRR